MPDVYDFAITGTLGPLSKSCMPELDTVAESAWTVLTGSAAGPDELRRVLDLLDARGFPASSVRITSRIGASPGSGRAG